VSIVPCSGIMQPGIHVRMMRTTLTLTLASGSGCTIKNLGHCDNSCCGAQGPGLWGEEFWNCADIQVVAEGQTTFQATSVTTFVPSLRTTTTITRSTNVATSQPSGNPTTQRPPLASPVARHGRLSTAGNKIVDEHGQSVQLRGMSLFWSQWSEGSKYYNGNVVQWLYDDWRVSLIRIAMGVQFGGFLENPAVERARVKTVVDAAIEVGLYVIIDWHDHHADQHIAEAKAFFEDVAATYGKFPNVIFETFNEPIHQSWSSVIKPYHEQIIPVIRRHSDNLIVLGSRTWSQDVDEASSNPVDGVNLVYSLHFYANTHRDSLRQKASQALANGIPLFVTEWGTCSADGNGQLDLDSAQVWLDFLQQNHISDANWAISDKDEKCAALRPGSDVDGAWHVGDLTNSGTFVRSSIRAFHSNDASTTRTSAPASSLEMSTSTRLWTTSRAPVSTTTSTISAVTTHGIKASTSTLAPHADCDVTCHDIKGTKECGKADIEWSMCSSSDTWWHSQCRASCAKCTSGLAPCTTPPPAHCDPWCANTKTAAECQNADTVWSMCAASDSWWQRQCAAFCGLCAGGLPPCQVQQGSSRQFRQDVATAPTLHAEPTARDGSFSSGVWSGSSFSHYLVLGCIAYTAIYSRL